MSLIPAITLDAGGDAGQLPNELPRTGSSTAWIAGIGVFVSLLGLYFVAVRKKWAS